jgi:hypothetical protein
VQPHSDATSLLLQSLQAAVTAPLQLLSYTAGVASRASKAALDLGQTTVNTAVNTTVNTAQAAASLPKAAAAAVAPAVRGVSNTAATAMQGATAQTAAAVQTALQRAALASRTGRHYAVTAGQTASQRAGQAAAGLGHSAAAGVGGLRSAAGAAGTSAAAGGRRLAGVAAQGVNRVDHLAVNGVTGLTQAVAGLVTGLYHTWLQRVWVPYVQLLQLFNNTLWSSAAAAGQLYLQGLTLTFQLLGQAAAAYYSLLTSAVTWVRQAVGSTAVNLTQYTWQAAGSTAVNLSHYGWQAAGLVYRGAWAAGQTYYNLLTATAQLLLRGAATAGGLTIEAARATERGATPLVNASVNALITTLPAVNAAAAQAVNTTVNATSAAAAQAVSAASDLAVAAAAKQQQVLGGPRSELMQSALTAGGQQARWSTPVLGQLLQDATEKGLTSRSAWLQPAASGTGRTAAAAGGAGTSGNTPASRGEGFQPEPAAQAAAAAYEAAQGKQGSPTTASTTSSIGSSSTPQPSPTAPKVGGDSAPKQPPAAAAESAAAGGEPNLGADQLVQAALQETAGGVHSVGVALGVEAPRDSGDTPKGGASAAGRGAQLSAGKATTAAGSGGGDAAGAEGGAEGSGSGPGGGDIAEGAGGGGKLPSPYKLGFGNSFRLSNITPDITPEHSGSNISSSSRASNLSEEDAADLDKEVAAMKVDQSNTQQQAGFDQRKGQQAGFDQVNTQQQAGFDQPKTQQQAGFDQPPTSTSSSSNKAAAGIKGESAQGGAPGAAATAAEYESPAAGLNQQAAELYATSASEVTRGPAESGDSQEAADVAPTTASNSSNSSSSRGNHKQQHQHQQLLPPETPVLLDASALDHMGSALTEDQVVLQPQGLLLAATGAGTGPKGGVTTGDTRVTPSLGSTGEGFPGIDSSASGAPSLGTDLAALGEVHTGLHRVPTPTLQQAVGEVVSTAAAAEAAAGDTFDAGDPLQQREMVVDAAEGKEGGNTGVGAEVAGGTEGEEAGAEGVSKQPAARQAAAAAAGLNATATDVLPAESASSIELLGSSPLIDMMSNALALGLTSEEDLSSEQPGRVARAVQKHYSSGKSSTTAEAAAAAAVGDVDGPAAAAGASYGSSIDLVPAASAPSSLPPTTARSMVSARSNPVKSAAAGRLPTLTESASSPAALQDTTSSSSGGGGRGGLGRPEALAHGRVNVTAAAPLGATTPPPRADSAGLQSGTFFRAESGAVGSWPSGPVVEEQLQELDQLLSKGDLLPSA